LLMLRTTKATFAHHQQAISWDNLPATFQHAISVTRCLGLEFIWIDSLCIIQDDAADWHHEGSKMASIYTNSYITLAASASENASEGLFPAPSDPKVQPAFERRRHADKAPYNIYVRPVQDHTKFIAGILPALQRAWIYQERSLSTRVVHFAGTELYWECRVKQFCECGDTWAIRHVSDSLKSDISRKLDADTQSSANDMRQWKHIVKQYTRLRIRYQSDIFPALQGIASVWERESTGDYLAGLWRANLVEGLLWHSSLLGHRPSTYRAPTWSWASVVGWIDWWPGTISAQHEMVEVLSASTTPVGDDPKGEITAGKIVLKGRCVTAKLVYEGTDELYRPGNCVEFEGPSDGAVKGLRVGPGDWFPDLGTNVGIDADVLVMQLVEIQEAGVATIYFIAFTRKDGENGQYERVGCARTVKWDISSAFRSRGKEMVITVV
jgi:hypothetical protein